MFHHFQYIHSWHMHVHDIDRSSRSMSNVDKPILDLQWVKVKCKYTIRKAIHVFLYNGNGNLYHNCYRLRDNYVIWHIWIFDFKREGQGNEVYVADDMLGYVLQLDEKGRSASTRLLLLLFISKRYTHTVFLSPMLKIG